MQVRKDRSILLSGITDGNIETLGSVSVKYMGHPVTLQVVKDNFPISQEGILGSDFLRNATKIDFIKKSILWQNTIIPFTQRSTVTIPSRSRVAIPMRIANQNVSEGYVPRMHICDNVYLGNALVANRNGRAFIGAVNTGEIDKEIEIPMVQLEEVETISARRPNDAPSIEKNNPVHRPENSNGETRKHTSRVAFVSTKNAPKQERACRIKSLLRLNHLNDEEESHVNKFIEEYSDLFQLSDDVLGYTNAMQHKINTTDPRPVHTKQYRYSPIHKEEINKQTKSLLDDDIICPSDSPYNSPL